MSLSVDKALRKAQCHLKAGELAEAEGLYKQVLSKFPKNKKAIQGYQKLKAAITSKSSLNPEPPQEQIQELISLYNQGQHEEVLLKAKPMSKLSPKASILFNLLGSSNMALLNYDEALENYNSALKIEPENADFLHNMGNALSGLGDIMAAIGLYEKAQEKMPDDSEVLYKIGVNLQKIGALDEAIDRYRRAIKIQPKYAEAYMNMGNILGEKGELDSAIESYKQALKIKPDYIEAYSNLGLALKDKGDPDAAIDNYKQALKIKPDYAEAYNNMGVALKDKGNPDAAIDNYKQALKIKPDYAEVYSNMGNALKEKGDLDAAIGSYKQAIKIKPDYAEAYSNMGIALTDKGELDAAIDSYKQAIKINPDHAEIYSNMGNVLSDKGELDAAIDSYKQALKIKPDYADAYSNMGVSLQEKGDLDAAIDSFKQALKIKPDHADAYNNMGNALKEKGELDAAIDSYKQALKIKPSHQSARSQKLHQQAKICDWAAIEEDRKLIPELGISTDFVTPFTLISLEDAPERHKLRCELYAKTRFKQAPLPLGPCPNQKPRRLRIGYFSTDFNNHPVSYLMAKLIETHDRDHFEVFGYSLGPAKDDEMRRRLIKGFDVFDDVKDMTDQDIALLARQDKIDIAVDLNGHTKHNRMGIFAYRAAPIQINYLGVATTTGAQFIDYIIADRITIPEMFSDQYTESIIYLPNCYQVNDNTTEISNQNMTRSEMGLPEKGFVFSCFNQSYKIQPTEFDVWMRLLHIVEGSVLWLYKSNYLMAKNLKKEAEKRGINAKRIVFSEKISYSEHIARHRLADIFLDTFHFNAGASASAALWAGLPIVCKTGKGFITRVTASMLSAIGMHELITETVQDYETLVLNLATNPKRLASIQRNLKHNRSSTPLFDTELFTKHLEDGYQKAYQRYFDGKQPRNIIVEE